MHLQGPFVTPRSGPVSVQGAVYPSTTKTLSLNLAEQYHHANKLEPPTSMLLILVSSGVED